MPSSRPLVASNNQVVGAREKVGLSAQLTHDDAATPEDHFEVRNERLAALRREVDELKVALASRTVIGIALGIIIEREHVTEQEAFQILKSMSQHTNEKVRDVAAQMAKDAQRPDRENPRTAGRIQSRVKQQSCVLETAAQSARH